MPTTVLLCFYFAQKLVLSFTEVFHKNSLIAVCCTFRKFEIQTLTPNRLKNQINDTLQLLATISTIYKGLLNKKMLLSINVVLS